MTEPKNLANALLIVASLYFLITNKDLSGWDIAGLMIVMAFGVATWGMWSNPFKDQERRFLEAKIKSEEARVLNFHAGTRQLLIQTKLLGDAVKR